MELWVKSQAQGKLLTEHTKPIVDGYDDDVAVTSQDAPVKHISRAFHVGSSVYEYHHGFRAPALTDVWKKEDRSD